MYIPYSHKNKPLHLFDLQVLAQFFITSSFLTSLVAPPHPYATKIALSATMNVRRSRRTLYFVVWMVCLSIMICQPFLLITYRGQSIEISSKSLLMVAMALATIMDGWWHNGSTQF